MAESSFGSSTAADNWRRRELGSKMAVSCLLLRHFQGVAMSSNLVPMSIKGLILDPVSNSPIVVLKDDAEKFFLPIWVGIFEANAIALQLENVSTPRPMTHDLLRNMIAELDARVTRVVINDLRDSTFFAQIRVITG